MRTLSVVLVASALIAGLSACSADAPELVRATVQTIPDTTIERPESPTIPETTAVTTTPAVEATTATTTAGAITTTAGATTTLDDPDGSTPIFSTARLSDETSLDTYPVVTGEWTDRDFARVAAGARREFDRQSSIRAPDLRLLEKWHTNEMASSSFSFLEANSTRGVEYRTGTIDEFTVYLVDRGDPELVFVNSCEQSNAAEYNLGNLNDPADDKLIQDRIGVKHTQRTLVRRGDVWLVSGLLNLEKSKCDDFF